MSLQQLWQQTGVELPSWVTKKSIFIGAGSLVCVCLILYIFSNSGTKKVDQIEELVRTNDKLRETIELLRKRATVSVRKNIAPHPNFITLEAGQGFQSLSSLKSDIYIPRGAVFKARLVTSIKTSLQESFVIGETTHSFEMDFRRRIEKGSRLIGSATFDRALKGVVVKFDTLVTPKNIQYDDLSLIALSENAYPLIDGIYFSDAGSKYGTALAFGFLSGFASGGMEREPTIGGSVAKPSLSNQALSGLSVASFKVAEEAMDSLKDESIEHIVVPAGADIYVAFQRKWILHGSERGNLK